MMVFESTGKHSEEVFKYFDFAKLDPFYNQDVLSALLNESWNSILITDGAGNAFLNVYVKNNIPGTDLTDIEPYFGHSGPITNTDDPAFIKSALATYIDHQQKNNVVAEFFRFNPNHDNQLLFQDTEVKFFGSKKIVIANCHPDEDQQFLEYSRTRRNIIRRAKEKFEFTTLQGLDSMEVFKSMYDRTMDRVQADKKWYFDIDFYKRLDACENFKFYAAIHEGEIASAIIIIEHECMSYYYLSAGAEQFVQGSSEFTIHNAMLELAKRGHKNLLLGGGATSDDNDSLLEFKRKFTKHPIVDYAIGGLVFDQAIYNDLVEKAVEKNPSIADIRFFLKYRL